MRRVRVYRTYFRRQFYTYTLSIGLPLFAAVSFFPLLQLTHPEELSASAGNSLFERLGGVGNLADIVSWREPGAPSERVWMNDGVALVTGIKI